MKKTFAFLLVFAVIGASASSEQHYKISSKNFDGAKLMKRYNLKLEDFRAYYKDGEMFVMIYDGVTIPDPPIFEAPDTTKRDRLAALRLVLRSGDLNVSQINEYLRLKAGL